MAPMTPAAATRPSTARQCMFACTRGIDRQITAIIPIRKNGRPWKEDCPAAIARNDTLRATRHYGRAFWKRWTGYHARSRIEAKMTSQVLSDLWRSPARPQGLWGADRRERPGPANCRNPSPHRPHKPLQRTRHRRDRSRGLKPTGKGEVTPQTKVAQQCPRTPNCLPSLTPRGARSGFS